MSGDWKPRKGQKIEKLFAWIATEADGGEGVCAGATPDGLGMMPLIGADRERIESYRPLAKDIRRLSGLPIRMVEFSTRVDEDELP